MRFSLLDLLILAIAAWRLAYLLTHEDAPFGVMRRIRERDAFGRLFSCIRCVSIWTAALVVTVYTLIQPVTFVEWLILVPAVSGGALMLASWTGANHPI